MKNKQRLINIVLGGLLFFTSLTFADSLNIDKANKIIATMQENSQEISDFQSNVRMILKSKKDSASKERLLRFKALLESKDSGKLLVVIDKPKDLRNTALLIHENGKESAQWIYLPVTKRVKKISSKSKSGSFLGSEFSYEDLSIQSSSNYQYRWLYDELNRGVDCFVIEQVSNDKYSKYSKVLVWINKNRFTIEKAQYFDKKKAHIKTLLLSDYYLFNNKYWRAKKTSMKNMITQSETILLLDDMQLNVGLRSNDFLLSTLKRGSF